MSVMVLVLLVWHVVTDVSVFSGAVSVVSVAARKDQCSSW